MLHHVKDLSAYQRTAIESLLGRSLSDEETLTIRPAKILQDAPVGNERDGAFRRYQNHLDLLADRVRDVLEEQIDATIDEALNSIRRRAG